MPLPPEPPQIALSPPIIRESFTSTVRLVASARLRAPVLETLVDNETELAALAEIEGATSGRLLAQRRGVEALPPQELVYGVPHAAFINASFAYAKPREPMRFNPAKRGAWYSALKVETCISEVGFHLTKALADAGDYNATVDYAEMFASMSGAFADLREQTSHAALNPDPVQGYPAGNMLAEAVRAQGHNGIIYPSVRHRGGTCIVALRPNVVQSAAQGGLHRLIWSGTAHYTITQAE